MIYLEEDKRVKSWKKCNKKKEKDGSCKMSYLSGCLQDWKITSQTSVFRFLGLFSPIYQSTNKNSLYAGIYIFLKNHFPLIRKSFLFPEVLYVVMVLFSALGKIHDFFPGKINDFMGKKYQKEWRKKLAFWCPIFSPQLVRNYFHPHPPLGDVIEKSIHPCYVLTTTGCRSQ